MPRTVRRRPSHRFKEASFSSVMLVTGYDAS
jgi:hypothetical protein